VANGKVMNYANKGTKFDEEVLLTTEGVATNDPSGACVIDLGCSSCVSPIDGTV
jgi:LDH2 family malate/lactate/ureidoglycolate dehydrogenase